MRDLEQLDQVPLNPSPPPAPILTSDVEAHAQLKRNLKVALDKHHEFMTGTAPEETAADKRLALEAANQTVKAALATDRTALRARQDNVMETVMLRAIFARKSLGYPVRPEDEARLRNAPRAQLEAALGPRQTAEFDRLEWGD